MKSTLKENQKSLFRIGSKGFLLILVFHLAYVLLKLYSICTNLLNPLIPQALLLEVCEPLLKKAWVLLLGVAFGGWAVKFHQYILATFISIAVLLVFYFTRFQPDFGG